MSCTTTSVQDALCVSGIGNETDPVKLLQMIAQILADQLVAISPSTSITPDSILARACASGIGKIQDPIILQQIIAQNGCDLSS